MHAQINLIHITDLHFSHPEKVMPEIGVSTKSSLQHVVQHIKNETHDAVLCTGDLIDTPTSETYEALYSVLAPLATPTFCLPGNHDQPQIGLTSAKNTTVQWIQSILMGNWQLIFLNSQLPGAAQGFLGEEELSMLDKRLTQFPDKHALVCLHHHPVKFNSKWLDEIMLQDHEELFDTLNKHKNVKGLLWGHVHQEYDNLHNGVRMLATPSTCRQFKPLSDDFEIDTKPPAYRRLALISDGTIDTETIYCDLAS